VTDLQTLIWRRQQLVYYLSRNPSEPLRLSIQAELDRLDEVIPKPPYLFPEPKDA
jgi:hypothetical protein